MYLHEDRGERLKNADRFVAAAKERGVAPRPPRRVTDGTRVGARAKPAQRPAPLDERLPGKLEGRRGRRNRNAPQRHVVPEKRIGLLADARPEASALRGVDELAADFFPRGGYRGSRAREAHSQLASGPGARADRQGLAAPFVERFDRLVLGELEPERRLGRRARKSLERDFQDDAERAERP